MNILKFQYTQRWIQYGESNTPFIWRWLFKRREGRETIFAAIFVFLWKKNLSVLFVNWQIFIVFTPSLLAKEESTLAFLHTLELKVKNKNMADEDLLDKTEKLELQILRNIFILLQTLSMNFAKSLIFFFSLVSAHILQNQM